MKPLTIHSFKCEKIRSVSSDLKVVDDFNYTSVKFEYNGEAVPPLRIDGSFRLFRHKNSKGPIYSLSIKVQMKCFFFIPEFERAAKIRKIAVYRFLISLLVPEL